MQTVEKSLSFNLTNLKDNIVFKIGGSGVSKWSDGSEIGFSIKIVNEDLKELTLSYRIDGESIKYKVKIVSFPSNLGRGKIWYLICPDMGKRCWKLVKPKHEFYFLHRTAYKLLYKDQLQNKNKVSRLFKIIDIYDSYCDAFNDLNEKYRKMHYKGKLTKLVKKVMRLKNKVDRIRGLTK